jgi:hypothetical protein
VKIVFDNKNLKNTEIYSLYFYELDIENNSEILVNSISNSDIKVFSNYICGDNELSELIRKTRKTKYFPIDLETKSYNLTMENNPIFDVNHTIEYKFRDTDND